MQIVFQCLQSTVYVLNCHGALYTLTTKHHSHKHVNSAVSHPSTTQPRRRAQIRNDAARTPNTSSKSRVILRDRDCSFLGGLSLPPAPSPLTAGTPPSRLRPPHVPDLPLPSHCNFFLLFNCDSLRFNTSLRSTLSIYSFVYRLVGLGKRKMETRKRKQKCGGNLNSPCDLSGKGIGRGGGDAWREGRVGRGGPTVMTSQDSLC